MDEIIMTLILVILILLTAMGGRYLLRARFKDITWADTLVFLCAVSLLFLGILRIHDIPDWAAAGIVFFAIIFVLTVIWFVIYSLFAVPRIDHVIHKGWIQIWPQVVARRKINKAVLDHAQAITRMNLPLAEGFFLAGRQTPGRSGVVLEAMATFLHQGLSLSEAYARYKARSSLLLSMMQVGERCGRLPYVLEYLQDYNDRERRERHRWIPAWWPYPIVVLTVMLLIVTFVMVVIVPKFETIFRDFGTTLPVATQILIRISNGVAGYFGFFWLGLAIVVGMVIYFRLRPRAYPHLRPMERFSDRAIWLIPGLRDKREFRGLAHAAAIMRLAIGSGMTMPEAVQCAADLDLPIVLRRRFQQLQERIVQGEPMDQAGQKVHLPPRFLWALRSGQTREAMQASLGLIEKYYSLVASHWSRTIYSVVWPVIVVILGGFVGFVDLALFLPLVKLIRSVTSL